MSSIPAIALSGMTAAQLGLRTSAHNIANLNSTDFRRQETVQTSDGTGGVSTSVRQAMQSGNAMETDVVDQLQAKNAFLANLAVFRANDRMTGSLIDLVS
jgi:flagellar hook-associated protein FlgK